MTSNKLLAKNTLLLYFRMILMLLATLYTSRIVLQELGFVDFGIYNLIQGVIVSFSFLNGSLVSASQRFLSFALGKKDYQEYFKVFSTCIILFSSIAVIICAILEPVGLWMIKTKLVIPTDRLDSAINLFHISVITFFLSFIRIPFNAIIVANEKMDFFAYIGIAEAMLKLISVFLLSISPFDKLIFYGTLLLITAILFFSINAIYCIVKMKARFVFTLNMNRSIQILSFSGWSLYEGIANIGKTEITNFFLNGAYGVLVNAAVGVAKQVNSAILQFVSNFQTAFQPQITKTYASKDSQRLLYLIINTSKYSYVIFSMLSIPVCFNLTYILNLWLGDVPEYSNYFAIFFILSFVFETLGGPFWITGHAIGDIRNLQVVTGTIRLISIPLTYLYINLGLCVNYIFSILVLAEIFIFIYRLYYLRSKIAFPVLRYLKEVLFKLIVVTCVACMALVLLRLTLENNFIYLLLSTTISTSIIALMSLYYLMSQQERYKIINIIKSKIHL